MAHFSTGSGFASRPGLSARQPLFPSQPPSDQVAVNIEEGNAYDLDEDIEGLRESVGRLKQVSYAIQEETALTQRVLESLEGAMETARLTFKQTMKRLDRVAKKTRSNHVIYVFLFGFALFMAFYFWTKVYRFLKWIL